MSLLICRCFRQISDVMCKVCKHPAYSTWNLVVVWVPKIPVPCVSFGPSQPASHRLFAFTEMLDVCESLQEPNQCEES